MDFRLPKQLLLTTTLLMVPFAMSAQGQYSPSGPSSSCSPNQYPVGMAPPPSYNMMYPGYTGMCPPGGRPYGAMPPMPFQPYFLPPHPCLPAPVAPAPETPGQPTQPTPPAQPSQAPQQMQPSDLTPPADTSGQTDQSTSNNLFTSAGAGQDLAEPGGGQGAAGGGSGVALAAPGGYLDNPIPISTFRLRNDAAFNLNRPDRAEYFYGGWQELGFHPHGIQGQGHGPFFDPRAIGPDLLPSNIDYQQPEAYFELAPTKRFSAFIQVPYRVIEFRNLQEDNPEAEHKRNSLDQPNAGNQPQNQFFPEPPNENESHHQTTFNGFSDLQFGFKYALLASPTQYLTSQLRLYAPSGDPGLGLGTGHWSIEPSLLYYKRWNRLVLQGQLTDWTPIDGGLAGNIIQYGAGLGYAVYQRGNCVIMPVTEYLGWTVLNGYESVFQPMNVTQPPGLELPLTHGVKEAGGDTIINGKWGVRAYFGNGSSLFVGYGRALTGTHWYTDDFRIEYRLFFGRNRNLFRPL